MSERATVFHCPYCADEDLRPAEDYLDQAPGAWACGACLRVFTVRLLGWGNRSRASSTSATEQEAAL